MPDHHGLCPRPSRSRCACSTVDLGALAQVLAQKLPSPAKADEVQVAQLSSNTRINRAPEVDPQGFGFHLECVPVGLARLDFGVLAGQQLKAGVQEVRSSKELRLVADTARCMIVMRCEFASAYSAMSLSAHFRAAGALPEAAGRASAGGGRRGIGALAGECGLVEGCCQKAQ